MTIAIFLGALLGAMALGMPIAYALLVCGVALMVHLDMFDAQILAQNVINGADSFPLLAVPFFMLAGEIMNAGGLSGASSTWPWPGRPRARRPGLRGHHGRRDDGRAVGLGRGRHRGAGGAAAADDGARRPRQGAARRPDRRRPASSRRSSRRRSAS
jgi:hypothetical protein